MKQNYEVHIYNQVITGSNDVRLTVPSSILLTRFFDRLFTPDSFSNPVPKR